MATVTLPWDARAVTIIRHDDENPAQPPDGHLVLYTIAQPEPFINIPSNSVSAHPTRRRPAHTYASPPPPIFAATRFRLPLPPTNDPKYRYEVYVGGQVGLQLSKCCSVGEDVDTNYLRYAIENIIDKPKTEFPSEWGQKKKPVHAIYKPLYGEMTYVTHAFLLAHMVKQQHKHWCELSLWDEVDLEPLLGSGSFWAKGSKVSWDSIYIVAIRKHLAKENHGAAATWFPELQIHSNTDSANSPRPA
ncbi:hypothetical protein TRAPUB_479 [Trametes pubescens]|uniref:Uncharacterized protein n=1 Tax=Trametes pubescens TaxID=154538 RepID=A0A1M2VM51_TRAPU|nr:hypothetical protein TRAPUB_479 [Trametes pubescens]